MTTGMFRNWVRLRWLESCAEHDGFDQQPNTITVYWQQYKWWLRGQYRLQHPGKQRYKQQVNQ